MIKRLLILLFPLLVLSQETVMIGDVDCDGQITSEDASLILQFITSEIEELPCQENMTGLTPEQLEDMMSLLSEQINGNDQQPITMIGPMYIQDEFPVFSESIFTDYLYSLYFYEAVKFCSDLEYDGYTDWFIPSQKQIFNYLKDSSSAFSIPNQDQDRDFFLHNFYEEKIRLLYVSLEYGPLYPSYTNLWGLVSCFCVR